MNRSLPGNKLQTQRHFRDNACVKQSNGTLRVDVLYAGRLAVIKMQRIRQHSRIEDYSIVEALPINDQ
jgi:hypothetical protein